MLKAQATFSPLENGENKHSTPLVNDKLSEEELGYRMLRMYHSKTENLYSLQPDLRLLILEKAKSSAEERQIFISSYLQDLHLYLSTNIGLKVPGLSLVTDKEVDDSKICRMIEEPFQYQQGIKKMICNCNRNFTISRVCLDLQYYSPISIKFKGEDLLLTPEKLLDHGLVHQIICSIKHNADKFSNMGLAFSTCHIYKILTVKQWGGNPNLSREFSEPSKPRFFNYWDYQRAWFNAFLIQNRDFHHSWMFYFPSKNQLSSFPFWFYSWWTYYGPTIKILPKPILDGCLSS